eukprot:GEMP01012416.1.p1 GENE.GEMP01012416.1~~GEMP01012416.1.p1  ORF type:complete len:498 (+),score=138.77 GEMP01012416.1:298-1791(+)
MPPRRAVSSKASPATASRATASRPTPTVKTGTFITTTTTHITVKMTPHQTVLATVTTASAAPQLGVKSPPPNPQLRSSITQVRTLQECADPFVEVLYGGHLENALPHSSASPEMPRLWQRVDVPPPQLFTMAHGVRGLHTPHPVDAPARGRHGDACIASPPLADRTPRKTNDNVPILVPPNACADMMKGEKTQSTGKNTKSGGKTSSASDKKTTTAPTATPTKSTTDLVKGTTKQSPAQVPIIDLVSVDVHVSFLSGESVYFSACTSVLDVRVRVATCAEDFYPDITLWEVSIPEEHPCVLEDDDMEPPPYVVAIVKPVENYDKGLWKLAVSKHALALDEEGVRRAVKGMDEVISGYGARVCTEAFMNHIGSSPTAPVARILLECKAEVNTLAAQTGSTALHLACHKNAHELVTLLLEHKAEVNKMDKYGQTSLMQACINGHVTVVERLIEHKAQVNNPHEKGLATLNLAKAMGHHQVAELLLAAGAVDKKPEYIVD